jgi:small subunit ribosomal protein S1
VGDKVQVKVMEIDLDRRRISLSMKAAAETLGTEVVVKPLEGEAAAAVESAEDAEVAPEAEAVAPEAAPEAEAEATEE